ncbi:hypothetical protein TNCV_3358101 [Trichonephila clavipes]|nr:hypothetical protein TNCV_3358101 [Trichonephila clavipes]
MHLVALHGGSSKAMTNGKAVPRLHFRTYFPSSGLCLREPLTTHQKTDSSRSNCLVMSSEQHYESSLAAEFYPAPRKR